MTLRLVERKLRLGWYETVLPVLYALYVLCYIVQANFGDLHFVAMVGRIIVVLVTVATLGLFPRVWLRTGKDQKATVIWLIFFIAAYTSGLIYADDWNNTVELRRTLVAMTTQAGLLTMVILSCGCEGRIARRIDLVTLMVALVVAVLGIYEWEISSNTYSITRGRLGGIFAHSSITGSWLVAGIVVLFLGSLRKYRRISFVIGLVCSYACLLTGAFFAIASTAMLWLTYALNISRNRQKRLLAFASLTVVVFMVVLSVKEMVFADGVVNYRVTDLIASVVTGDADRVVNSSSFTARWAANVGGAKLLESHIFKGRGIDSNKVYVEYVKNGRNISGIMSIHNSFISTWLMAGAFPSLVFVIFLVRYLVLVARGMRKRGYNIAGGVVVVIIFVGVNLVTNPLDTTIFPLLIIFANVLHDG